MRFEAPDGLLDGYKHMQNDRGTIGVLVELGGVDPSDAQGAARSRTRSRCTSSFAAPPYLTRDEVPADVVERERGVIEAKSRNEGVPEDKLAGSSRAGSTAFYKDVVLLEQAS